MVNVSQFLYISTRHQLSFSRHDGDKLIRFHAVRPYFLEVASGRIFIGIRNQA
jgi:hypothetical protein